MAEKEKVNTTTTAAVKPASQLDWLSGGLQVDDTNPQTSLQNMRVRLTQALKFFDLRFRQMESKDDKLEQMLGFVSNLGLFQLKDLTEEDYELHIKLEQLLVDTLREAYEQQTLDSMGLSSTNKRLQKKKLKKKQK